MPVSPIEQQVNVWRGWCCVVITAWAMLIVLAEPQSFVFWQPARGLPCLAFEETGAPGLVLSASFGTYLIVDCCVAFIWRAHFRRSMGAVYLHHVAVAVGVAAFLLPSPPRGFFMYVWGEALTACRVLPPAVRFRGRSAVFAFRRVLWIYLLVRDVYLFHTTTARRGAVAAAVPPATALLLLGLDAMWWAEHVKQSRPKSLSGEREAMLSAPVSSASGLQVDVEAPSPGVATGRGFARDERRHRVGERRFEPVEEGVEVADEFDVPEGLNTP